MELLLAYLTKVVTEASVDHLWKSGPDSLGNPIVTEAPSRACHDGEGLTPALAGVLNLHPPPMVTFPLKLYLRQGLPSLQLHTPACLW